MQQQKVEDQNTIHLMFRPVNFNYSDRITVVYIQQIGLVNRERMLRCFYFTEKQLYSILNLRFICARFADLDFKLYIK